MIALRPRQRGMVLVTALLMLIVVTILALAMFRSFGLDEKIAGNLREKQRALSAAETAEQYAEYWLTSGGGSTNSGPVVCSSVVAASVSPQICTNPLASATQLPWLAGGNPVGVTYAPSVPSAMNVTTTPIQGSYYATPAFYIQYVGTNSTGAIYQIDAQGYGGSPDTVAVVEATYIVQSGVKNLSPNTQ
jgi:type IV pilus assembly protein PilX